jgi:signal transduction histidine kinase
MAELITSTSAGPVGLSAEDANRRLRERYAEIAQLAGGLAHEIRNPLSTMSLNLDLLAEDFLDAETPRDRRVQAKVQRLRKETQRLHDILENFLRYAKVQELRLETADLSLVVEELRDFFEPQAMASGIVIRTHYEDDLPRVSLDADLFRQALLNLLINARQAMPDGGDLMLRTRAEGPWNVVEVTDTGLGMSDDVQGRVFDAFFTTRPGGSGLGLATTRRLVESHGGSIHVRSEPGKGSQFTIRLPVTKG